VPAGQALDDIFIEWRIIATNPKFHLIALINMVVTTSYRQNWIYSD
jgi:hypothetical protein